MTGEAGDEVCVIIGGGPAGLTAAYEASKLGIRAKVFEKGAIVGGISRTDVYKGYRFDIGGHRFFTKVGEIEEIWRELLGDDLLVRPRLSRIYFRGRFFAYPIKPLNALWGLGPIEAVRIALSYARAQIVPSTEERTFEQWVSNRFGRRLFEIFFKTYTEKVWGMPCNEIGADWAAQRIQNLDLVTAVKNALLERRKAGRATVRTLIDEFLYPRLGPGMLWERCREILEEKGTPTQTKVEVVRLEHDGRRVHAVEVRDAAGEVRREPASHVLSSMPIRELIHALDPPAPEGVRAAADRLRYRDFLTVALIIDREELFPDNWIYIHAPDVRVGRIQNFKQWSPEMVPDPKRSSLGLEYFVQEGDDLWSSSDDDLIALASKECAMLGLVEAGEVLDGTVVRIQKAYPVYDDAYQSVLAEIREYLAGLSNLQLIGRNGQHRYNNQDHSMATALYAMRNIAGAEHDVWSVNVDQEYLEEDDGTKAASSDRLVPRLVSTKVDETTIRGAFARYDVFALGVALSVVATFLLLVPTLLALSRGADAPMLSLIGNFLIGYELSWVGAAVGAAEAGFVGFGLGVLLGVAINATVGWHERSYRRRVELGAMLE